MQIKTIKSKITNKLEDWFNTIDDLSLVSNLRKDVIVTGGAIASLLLGDPINDYDIYIRTKTTLMRVVKYYVKSASGVTILDGKNKDSYISDYKKNSNDPYNGYTIAVNNLKEDQIKLFFDNEPGYKADIPENNGKPTPKDAKKYRLSYMSPNAISLTDDIQIVIRFWGEPDVIHESYDFVHATNYFTFKEGVVTNKEALESLLTKQLIYKGSLYPVTSIIRSKKFITRNWKINAGEMLKMIFQVSLLDLTNYDILEEQLIGVDVAYFAQLITILRKLKVPLNITVLGNIIDKIFNDE